MLVMVSDSGETRGTADPGNWNVSTALTQVGAHATTPPQCSRKSGRECAVDRESACSISWRTSEPSSFTAGFTTMALDVLSQYASTAAPFTTIAASSGAWNHLTCSNGPTRCEHASTISHHSE